MKEIGRPLGVGGGGEYEPPVVLQRVQPAFDIAGVVRPRL